MTTSSTMTTMSKRTTMTTVGRALLVLLAVTPLAACHLYFPGDDCVESADLRAPAAEVRDPATGLCTSPYGGGGGGCGDEIMPAGGAPEPAIFLDWAMCYSACETYDEATCAVADGCRVIYAELCTGGRECTSEVFAACWATAPSGPVIGVCDGLDAYECSRHGDCIAVHENADCGPDALCAPTPAAFLYCRDEVPVDVSGCYSDDDCIRGEERCNAGDVCLPPPGCDPGETCPEVCYGECVPIDEPPPPPPSGCSDYDEATCIDMIDGCTVGADGTILCADIACEPVYEGQDCTCDESGCRCVTWLFASCREATAP